MSEPPVIVTGMHRSGTTLLAKLLEQCGLFMGSKKYGNEEAVFFQEINRWLIYQANTSWDDPGAFRFIHEAYMAKAINAMEWRLRSVHIKEYLGVKKALNYRSIHNLDFPWGWKDPVNTITLDLWMTVFPASKIVNIIRNPLDVANSLKLREEKRMATYVADTDLSQREKRLTKKPAYSQSYRVMDVKEGVKLALKYMELNRVSLQKYAYSYQIIYEDLLSDPDTELKKLTDFLQFPVSRGDFEKALQMIKPDQAYKFLREADSIQLFKEMKLEEPFTQYGFRQPRFKS